MRCPYCQIELDLEQIKIKRCYCCRHKWEIFHVIPANDLMKHNQSYNCHCEPVIKESFNNIIIVHNSFDGREGVEWANEILNK